MDPQPCVVFPVDGHRNRLCDERCEGCASRVINVGFCDIHGSNIAVGVRAR